MTDSILGGNEAPVVEAAVEAPVEVAAVEAVAEAVVESPAVVDDFNMFDHLSDDYKSVVESKGFKDINDVVKSYSNLEKMVGNSIRIPSEDSSPEAKADFYEKLKGLDGVIVKGEDKNDLYSQLGRPETAEGYAFSEMLEQGVIDSVPGISQELEEFQATAHDLGLSKEQASKLVEMRMHGLKGMGEQAAAQREAGQVALKEMWGQDYDNRLVAAKKVAKMYSDKHPEAMESLINGPAGNNPAFLNMLSELGASFKEKGHEGMGGTTFGTSPAEAVAKIAEKRSDRGFMEAYQNNMSPGHDQAVADMRKLYQLANGQ